MIIVQEAIPQISLFFLIARGDIEGIEINGTTCFKMSCYADDLTCFPKNLRSARNIMQVLDKFHRCSSLKVDIEKK